MKLILSLLIAYLLLEIKLFGQKEFLNISSNQKLFIEQSVSKANSNPDSLMLNSAIRSYMNSNNIAGLATLIVKDNQIVWNKNYGYRNVENQLPVEDSTIFLVASVSKLIIATAVMQLWENGMINLESDINNYLPVGFSVRNPNYPNDSIAVKMLMTHTSSIQDDWNILDPLAVCGDSPIPLDTFLINYLIPGSKYYSQFSFYSYKPGQYYNYSNVGTSLLALMIEKLTGKSFSEYCKDSIFNPLAMNKTSWFLNGMSISEIAIPYIGSNPLCHQGWAAYPSGFLRTTKLELANFLSAYINKGLFNNYRLLKSSTIDYMLSDQFGYIIDGIRIQGLIWHKLLPRDPSLWVHGGNWEGVETYAGINPNDGYGIIWFQNSGNPNSTFKSAEILPRFYKYAKLYGNIYATNSSVNKSYARKNIDSVLFRTNFSNLYNHQFIPYLIFVNSDSTKIDSLMLYNDGMHGDSLSNDEIFGNIIPPQLGENFYSLAVSTIDVQTGKYLNTPEINSFTTAGPITIDSVSYRKGLLNYHYVRPFVHNLGTTKTIPNAGLRIICNDPWIASLATGSVAMPDIAPNSSVGLSSWITISVIDSIFPGYFNFKFEVSSNGIAYWSDSMTVNLLTEVDEEIVIPSVFRLEQNYPNPFNPSTTISFSIPISEFVTLKVYDVLGNEVTILVDEYKPTGSYEVDFNAINLPSGVYLYKLQAGNFVETKKLILLK
jgi:CubicO group peptidase (beta-lactamase class C family)